MTFGTCPQCGASLRLVSTVPHPSRNRTAIHDYACGACAFLGSKVVTFEEEREVCSAAIAA